MKITAKLALNQLKLNSKRAMGTIFSISLSTSLITATMCFATSGYKMLTDFLGTEYGNCNEIYTFIVAIPTLILVSLIAFMSVTIISNIFAANANKRIQELGILKCVGATGKQIKESVIYESLWISLLAIPIGLIIGTVIGYTGVKIAGHYVYNINELSKSIIMRPVSFSLSFHISIWTYIFASAFSLMIIILSASKPAKTVGKINAIECIKGLAANKDFKNKAVNNRLIEAAFGYESALAYTNLTRNSAGYKSTIKALALSILLILFAGSISAQADEFEKWINPDSEEVNVDYCSIRDIKINEVTGKTQETIIAPISSQIYNEITVRLSEYENIEVYGIGSDACTYNALLDLSKLSKAMQAAPNIFDENSETELSLLSVSENLYQKLCDRIGAAYGSNLLINSYEYNDNGYWKTIEPFNENINEITLIDASGKKSSLTIGGILHESDLIEKGFHEITPNPVRIIVPNIDARYFDWYCKPQNEHGYTEYAKGILNEYYPILTDDSYIQQGYTVRISRADTMIKMLNVAILLGEIIIYGFIMIIILMGFTSAVSTIATNIKIRSREFAILRSIGMTTSALRKMLYSEIIFCIIRALFIGVIPGIIIPFAINLSIRQVFPILYHIPWKAFGIGLLVLICAIVLITYIELNKLKHQNIIEEIRLDLV